VSVTRRTDSNEPHGQTIREMYFYLKLAVRSGTVPDIRI